MEARRGEVTCYPAKSGKLALEPGVAFFPSHHTYCQLYPPSQARFWHVRFSDFVYVGHLQPLIINTCLYWGGLGSFYKEKVHLGICTASLELDAAVSYQGEAETPRSAGNSRSCIHSGLRAWSDWVQASAHDEMLDLRQHLTLIFK